MKKVLVLITLITVNVSAQDITPLKDKYTIDSLSKVHKKKVVGFTKINGKITHFQFVENKKQWDMSLVGFRLKTLCVKLPNRSTDGTIN
jgi:hypothetical protein